MRSRPVLGGPRSVVIACSKCKTRFHVDDTRVPAGGVRVRCSRCKHAFFVRPPHASDEEPVHGIAAAAAAAEESAAPPPSFDLDAPAGAAPSPADEPPFPGPAGTPLEASEEEESDWQFAIDPPEAASERSPLELPQAAETEEPEPSFDVEPTTPEESQPDASSLADLDRPEDWDLLGESAAGAELEVEVEAQPEAGECEAASRFEPEAATPVPSAPRREAPRPASGARLQALGWLALAGLVAWLAHGAAVAAHAPTSLRPARIAVAGFEAREVSGSFLENLWIGPVFVVSGILESGATQAGRSGEAVRVVPLDARGAPLQGASAWVGAALPEAHLREGRPERLRADLERSAGRLARRDLRPGERFAFQALLTDLGSRTRRFRLEAAPAPQEPTPVSKRPKSLAEGEPLRPPEARPGGPAPPPEAPAWDGATP